MKKAVFLDRDGVINEDRGQYTFRPEDFRLLDGALDALLEMQRRGFRLVVISNQAGIARGLYTHADAQRLNRLLVEEAGARGVVIDEVYYCPHYTEIGRCLCRKPGSLLVEKALARFGLDAEASYFVGDQPRDMEAAAGAGVRGLLLETNTPLGGLLDRIR
jgi:D-glycero-D-manno-heptose 1,7-bisphosphate phosphatase